MPNIHEDIIEFWKDEPENTASDDDLAELEKDVGVALPESYKKYQKEIGYKRIYFKNDKYKWGEHEAGIKAAYDVGSERVEREIVFSYFIP